MPTGTLEQQMLTRFFEILKTSLLPAELAELLAAPTSAHFMVVQRGTDDALKISIPKVRGALGAWDASTNTPSLADSSGLEGDSYVVTTAGTVDFGSGVISFAVNDLVGYRNGRWMKTGFVMTKASLISTLGYTPEDQANKVVDLSVRNDILYPTTNAMGVELDKKVDKVTGKVLSDNNYTTEEKNKLAGLESSKYKGTYTSVTALNTAHPAPEIGSYGHVDPGTGANVELYIWDNDDTAWIRSGGSSSLTAAEIKSLYESNPDTNAFNDSEQNKLAGIEAGATADQTAAEIKTAYESNADTNAFTDALKTKLEGIADEIVWKASKASFPTTGVVDMMYVDVGGQKIYQWNATTVDYELIGGTELTAAEVKTLYESNVNTNEFSDAEKTKLSGIEANATADMTALEIKSAYESNTDTNAYTDAEKSKLAGLESSKFKGTYLSLSALQTAHPSPEEGSYAHVDGGTGSTVLFYAWDQQDGWTHIEGETPSLTATQVKTLYESNPDTNAYTDAEKSKLAGYSQKTVDNLVSHAEEFSEFADIHFSDTVLDDYSNIITELGSRPHNCILKLSTGDLKFVTRSDSNFDWNGYWIDDADDCMFNARTAVITNPSNLDRITWRTIGLEDQIVDGSETYNVYGIGQGHTSASSIPWGFTGRFNYWRPRKLRDEKGLQVDQVQSFTEAEKTQARENIDAEKRSAVRIVSANPTTQNFIDWEGDILLVKTTRNFVLPAAGALVDEARYLVKTDKTGIVNYSVADATVSIEYNDVNAIGTQSQRSETWILLKDNVYYITGEVS